MIWQEVKKHRTQHQLGGANSKISQQVNQQSIFSELTLKLICIMGRTWSKVPSQSTLMRELTAADSKHCSVLYLSRDTLAFEPRTSAIALGWIGKKSGKENYKSSFFARLGDIPNYCTGSFLLVKIIHIQQDTVFHILKWRRETCNGC